MILTRGDRETKGSAQGAPQDGVTFHFGDVTTFGWPDGDFTHVIHGATDTIGTRASDPRYLRNTIIGGTDRVLEFAELHGVKSMLHVSSGAVYAPQPGGMDRIPEDWVGACDTMNPRTTYGQAKRFAEHLCSIAYEEQSTAVKIARCFTFLGPGMPVCAHFAIGNFVRDAESGRPVCVKGDGTAVRSYLYAADWAVWLLRILAHGQPGRVYNVGSDSEISILDLAHLVVRTLDVQAGLTVERPRSGTGLRNRYVPSIDRARGEIGVDVWTGIQAAIQSSAEWYRRVKP